MTQSQEEKLNSLDKKMDSVLTAIQGGLGQEGITQKISNLSKEFEDHAESDRQMFNELKEDKAAIRGIVWFVGAVVTAVAILVKFL